MYTCRILVCHPTLLESDLKNAMSPEENRTIAHSPPPMTGTGSAGYGSAVVQFYNVLDDYVLENDGLCQFLFYI